MLPYSSRRFGSAPASRSIRTASIFPALAAAISTVSPVPSSDFAFTAAPASMRTARVSTPSSRAASISAVKLKVVLHKDVSPGIEKQLDDFRATVRYRNSQHRSASSAWARSVSGSSSISTISRCPSAAARISAVCRVPSFVLLSAPASSSTSNVSTCPSAAARINAVNDA